MKMSLMSSGPLRTLPAAGPARWLFSFDYDGTLRSGDETPPVSREFFELMSAWREEFGVRWGINTGRSINYLMEEYNAIAPFAPDFAVTCERYIHTAAPGARLLPDLRHNALCLDEHEKIFRRYHEKLEHLFTRLQEEFSSCRWNRAPGDPHSIEAETPGVLELFMPYIHRLLAECPGLSAQRTGPYLRFCHASFNKGTSLRRIADAWGVSTERILIMGDGHNDLDAFRLFPRALQACPANSHPEILAYAEKHGVYISSRPEHRAVLDVLVSLVRPVLQNPAH